MAFWRWSSRSVRSEWASDSPAVIRWASTTRLVRYSPLGRRGGGRAAGAPALHGGGRRNRVGPMARRAPAPDRPGRACDAHALPRPPGGSGVGAVGCRSPWSHCRSPECPTGVAGVGVVGEGCVPAYLIPRRPGVGYGPLRLSIDDAAGRRGLPRERRTIMDEQMIGDPDADVFEDDTDDEGGPVESAVQHRQLTRWPVDPAIAFAGGRGRWFPTSSRPTRPPMRGGS